MKTSQTQLMQVLSEAAHSQTLLKSVLADVFTPQEILEFEKRIQIFLLLRAGTSQRDIAKRLGVSISKITRGSRVLQENGKGIASLMAQGLLHGWRGTTHIRRAQ